MRGRKPKPSHLRIIEGNPGHRPINSDEPQPDTDIGEPPPHLSVRAQYYWREAIKHAPAGMIKQLDAGILTNYVVAQARREAAAQKVDEAGAIIKVPGNSGQFMQNPFLSVEKSMMAIIQSAGQDLGFTPSSRSRVKISGKKKTKSALGKLRELKI